MISSKKGRFILWVLEDQEAQQLNYQDKEEEKGAELYFLDGI
jgi:hypothetical protein